MKRKICLMLLCTVLCSGCRMKRNEAVIPEPKLDQMKAMCELAVMDCYYHNVAKLKETDVEGILFWKKDRNFWIEYTRIVQVGIDAAAINMEVKDNQVTITIPPAKVLNCKVDSESLTEESYIVAKDSAAVRAEHQTEAFKLAQENMEKTASENSFLLANAEQRAKKLLEDYVNNIGDAIGKEYEITFTVTE